MNSNFYAATYNWGYKRNNLISVSSLQITTLQIFYIIAISAAVY